MAIVEQLIRFMYELSYEQNVLMEMCVRKH